MLYCPQCGEETIEDSNYCVICGARLSIPPQRGLVDHLKYSVKLLIRRPIIFVPEITGSLLFSALFRANWFLWEFLDLPSIFPELLGLDTGITQVAYDDPTRVMPLIILLGLMIMIVLWLFSGVSGLFSFMTVDLMWSEYKDQSPSLVKSSKYVGGRIGKLYLASLISNLIAFTVILLPATLFMYVVMVVENTGISEALSKGFKLSLNRVKSSIGLVLILFIWALIPLPIPYVSDILRAVISTIIFGAAFDLYMTHRAHIFRTG